MPVGGDRHNKARTHCPQNHPYDEANTIVSREGWRSCRRCKADREAGAYERKRNAWLLRKHGLSLAEFNAMAEAQGWTCRLCGRECREQPAERGRAWKRECLVIDHDHATGAFRGLICDPCNKALGAVEDRVEVLEAMIRYLRE